MKYILSFNEYNGANLTVNLNPKTVKFDGGDGPSAESIPEPHHQYNTIIKPKKGNNAIKMQEIRRKKDKELSKEYRISKMMDYQTDDDMVSTNGIEKKPTKNAGGYTGN